MSWAKSFDERRDELCKDAEVALLLGVSAMIGTPEDEVLECFDALDRHAGMSGGSFIASAERLGVDLDGPLLAVCLSVALHRWIELRSRAALDAILAIRDLENDNRSHVRSMKRIAAAVAAVEDVASSSTPPARSLAGSALVDVAEAFASTTTAGADAWRIAAAAINFLPLDDARFGEALELARAGMEGADPEQQVALFVRQVQWSVFLAERDGADAVRALDEAREALAMAVGPAGSVDQRRAATIGSLTNDVLRLIAAIGQLLVRPEVPREWTDPSYRYARREWELQLPELAPAMASIAEWVCALENERMKLQRRDAVTTAETSWDTIAFNHPAFARAVPDGGSLGRSRDDDELLLVLAHEVTHVLCLLSDVGLGLLALRLAAVERECCLWFLCSPDTPVPLSLGVNQQLQPELLAAPTAPDLLVLAVAEQQLELIAKARALRSAWTAWFEGVAMFAELSGDPTDDPIARSTVTGVMANLVDAPLEVFTSESSSLGERLEGEMESADQRYHDALSRIGKYRLRSYFSDDPARYLPGYVMVRSVVAAWRRTLGGEMTGAVAARTLVHLTRVGTEEALPDLSLDLATFEKEVEIRTSKWIEGLARISADDLRLALGDFVSDTGTSHPWGRWRDGRYSHVAHDLASATARQDERFRGLLQEAARTLCGSRASADRVESPSTECRSLLEFFAEALTNAKPIAERFGETVISYAIGRFQAMPVASVSAPFWLNLPTRSLIVALRTREVAETTGKSSYNMRLLSFDEDKFRDLRTAAARYGSRLTVTRFALMWTGEGADFAGRSIMAYSLGDWLHLERRGLLIGTDEPESSDFLIRERLSPSWLLRVDTEAVSPGVPAARRTSDWLGSISPGEFSEEDDLSPWIARVSQLAEVLRSAHGSELAWSQLSRIVGSDVSTRLAAKGVEAVGELGAGHYDKLLRFLIDSGRSPADAPWTADDLSEIEAVVGGALFEGNEGEGWDVVVPMGYKSEEPPDA